MRSYPAYPYYIPGTHRLGESQPADFIVGTGQSARPGLPPLDWANRKTETVTVPARARELLVHHPLVWHMSPKPRAKQPLRGVDCGVG